MWHLSEDSQSHQNGFVYHELEGICQIDCDKIRIMTANSNISRRNFIRISSISSVALTLGFYKTASGSVVSIINPASETSGNVEMNAWISIDPLGKVTI